MQRNPRQKNAKHLDFIRSLPCVICGDNTTVEAAHIRMADPSVGKPMTGIGIRPDDKYSVPLCGKHHRKQHEGSEAKFWQESSIDPVKKALALYAVSGSYEQGIRIIMPLDSQLGIQLET